MNGSKTIILLILITMGYKAFPQQNEFPKEMYVTSEEGLNARESPSLNSTRVWSFIFAEQLTVQERGPAATIDGISDNWYKTFFYNGRYLDSCWVFGGYLSNEAPLYIIDKIKYSAAKLPENVPFNSVDDYLGKWVLLDSDGNADSSDSYFILYREQGAYKFLTKYHHTIRIGSITWTEYPGYIGIVMNPYNRNIASNHVPWSIVGRPSKTANTYAALIDNEGPLGFFRRMAEGE